MRKRGDGDGWKEAGPKLNRKEGLEEIWACSALTW